MNDRPIEEIRTSERSIQTSDRQAAESSQSLWRKRQSNSDVNRSQGRIRVINEPTKNITNESQFFEWWNGDKLVELSAFNKGTPLYWAIQGWEAALREMNKEAEKNGEEL